MTAVARSGSVRQEPAEDGRPALVGGLPVRTGNFLPVVDPSTGEPFAAVAECGPAEIDAAVAAARDCYEREWGQRQPRERAAVLRRIGTALEGRTEELAAVETADTGKPLSQARADVAAAARYFEFYANTVEGLYGESVVSRSDLVAFTVPEPHGVCGHITPWNYPLQVAARTVAPALAAGNCCVLKPSEDAPLTSLMLGEIALAEGLPPGGLNVVPGLGTVAGAALAAHPGVDHLALTGSRRAGTAVMAAAAENIVPVTLELGGKSPHLVFADADLDRVVPAVVGAIIEHAGQNCTAGSRVIVHESLRAELVERVAVAFAALTVGRGADDPDLGPLISERQRRRVLGFLDRADPVAKLVVGGGVPRDAPSTGFFVEPTLFDGVPTDSELAQQEIFGPVLCVTGFTEVPEALAAANGTEYGLSAAVWTSDPARAQWLARRIRVGQVFVNTYAIAGGAELPFAGRNRSGLGVEKGVAALREYSQFKTIAIAAEAPAS